MIKLPDELSPEDLREIAEYSLGIKLDDREPEIAHAIWLHFLAEVQRLNATAQRVSDGCKVPNEPTPEMQTAGATAIRFDTTPVNKLFTANAVYRAMLAAAPGGQDA